MKSPKIKYQKINELVIKHLAGDNNATVLLLKKFDGMIKRVALKYHKQESFLSYEDLYQHGVKIFLLLTLNYNIKQKVDFVKYIKSYYEGKFTDELGDV